ncbi:MAG: putative 7-carboxy-7-deazaguanine synthase QueE [Ruminococcus sp.]|nr:putative 7-carboxy-7-deazaguanine synthase QueE [Ruminococcus sp.]
MTMYPIAEKFVSINGEGVRAGELAVFIRFSGCNLSCGYCDTKWANEPDVPVENMTAEDIVGYVSETGVKNVTITGGEPLLQEELPELTDALMSAGFRVEIETNGSLPIESYSDRKYRPVFTMDYKLPSSGMEESMCGHNFGCLEKCDTVKFVAGSIKDLERAAELISEHYLTDRCHIYISPVFGEIAPAEIVEFMKEHKMNDIRLQLQLHKFIWPPEQRGV